MAQKKRAVIREKECQYHRYDEGEVCDSPVYSRGLCEKHYRRLVRSGTPVRVQNKVTVCGRPGCQEHIYCRGLCGKHYRKQMYAIRRIKEGHIDQYYTYSCERCVTKYGQQVPAAMTVYIEGVAYDLCRQCYATYMAVSIQHEIEEEGMRHG